MAKTVKKLQQVAEKLEERMSNCDLCPHLCGADRLNSKKGFCRILDEPVVSSFGPHFGEEPELVGFRGSGTIFFTACNLACSFCQNYDISQQDHGDIISIEKLADIMLSLQKRGCHNINLVTPTHQIQMIVSALAIATDKGLEIPVVYNCGGYELIDMIRLLEGIIDIYMPDFKWADNELGGTYSKAKDYADRAKEALIEMHRQVGPLKVNEKGIAESGLLIRHLVMPGMLGNTREILSFIAGELSKDTYINIMDQYRPAHKAWDISTINRRTTYDEHREALHFGESLGLYRGF